MPAIARTVVPSASTVSGRPVSAQLKGMHMDPSGPHITSTLELLQRIRGGDSRALELLFERHSDSLRRWASGRLPRWARGLVDTDDLVQDVLVRTLGRLDTFDPRGDGALQGYLRKAILNRIQDEVKRTRRRPSTRLVESGDAEATSSPLEEAVGRETAAQYERALGRLRPEEREAIIARVELVLSWQAVTDHLGKPSIAAAQMAVSRALVKLAREMEHDRS